MSKLIGPEKRIVTSKNKKSRGMVKSWMAIISIWLGFCWGATGNEVGASWRRVDNGLADRFSSVSWDGPVFVGVGTHGLVCTSTDGKSWATRFPTVHADLKAVAWNGSCYVAVGSYGTIIRSSDGIAWQKIDAAVANNYSGITWTGSQFIALDNSFYLSTSTDGIAWTRFAITTPSPVFTPGIEHFDGATYLRNGFGICRSTDLVTWTQVLSMSNNTTPAVIRKLNGRLFSVGPNNLIHSSSDGITWTPGSLNGVSFPSQDLRDIAWNGTCYIAVGSSNRVWRSEDGLAWTAENAVAGSADFVRWINSQFVIGGDRRSIQTSPDGREWTADRVNIYSRSNSLVWTGSRYITVGDYGYIATSTDFRTWMSRDSGIFSNLLSVVWTGSFALASGANGVVLKSSDGLEWNPVAPSNFTGSVQTVWTGSQLVAFSGSGTDTSTDGISWTRISTGAISPFNEIKWLRGMFIGVGGYTIYTSPDGVAWTQKTVGTTGLLWAVGASEDGFLVGGQNGVLLASTDGVNWTARTSPVSTVSALDYRFGRWIIASSSGIQHSVDGISWNLAPNVAPIPGLATQVKLVWTGSELVSTALDASTADGITWSQLEIRPTAPDFNAVTKGGSGGYVAVGNGGKIWHSADGYAWQGMASPTNSNLVALAANAGDWVAIGAAGVIVTSNDGIHWTLRSSGTVVALRDIAWNGQRFAAVGDSGTILVSSDGQTWSQQASGSTTAILNIVSMGSAFKALGGSGTIFESPDGITWTFILQDTFADVVWNGTSYVAVASGGGTAWAYVSNPDALQWTRYPVAATSFLSGMCWTGTQHVACGSSGTIVTSPDGVTWTPQVSGTTQWLQAVVWNGTQLVAVGQGGTLLASPDGITWTKGVKSGTLFNYEDVAWENGRYVAVGSNGASATSTDGLNWQAMTGSVGTNYTVERVGNRFLAAGANGSFYSTTATQWQTEQADVISLGINEFESYGSNLFAAASDGVHRFQESSPGRWTRVQVHASPSLDKMTRHDGEFVATGNYGTVVLSRDGALWKNVKGGRQNAFDAVAGNGNQMVGVGLSRIQITGDGTTWNAPDPPVSVLNQPLHDIIWTGSRFLAMGLNSLFFSSSNGQQWTGIGKSECPYTQAVAGNDGFLVAVGTGGIIAVSDGYGSSAVNYDTWMSAQGAESGSSAPALDANSDGISNLMAYFLGIPAVDTVMPAERSALPTLSFGPGNGGLTFTFDLRQSYRPGATYHVEASPNLQPNTWQVLQSHTTGWSDIPGQASITESPLPGGGIRITVSLLQQFENFESCYFRLRATLP